MTCAVLIFYSWNDVLFFVKQKTAYEMGIRDWSSDVCSSDLLVLPPLPRRQIEEIRHRLKIGRALFEEVEFDRKMRLGRGFVALFTGPSGTGKTMAAELMARERGIDLYKGNLGQDRKSTRLNSSH